jgi:hypothetical protein
MPMPRFVAVTQEGHYWLRLRHTAQPLTALTPPACIPCPNGCGRAFTQRRSLASVARRSCAFARATALFSLVRSIHGQCRR